MGWDYRGSIQASREWQLSVLLTTPLIRIVSDTPAGTPYRGLIAMARPSEPGIAYSQIKRIWATPEIQLVRFDNDLQTLGGYQLAFKATRGRNVQRWSIQIQQWDAPLDEGIVISPGEILEGGLIG